MTYNWRTEKSLTSYPLAEGIGIENFIIDAVFIQFDGFIPVLQTIVVTEESIHISILFDTGVKKKTIGSGGTVDGDIIKFYDGSRFLGKLLLGPGFTTMWDKFTDQTLTLNTQFISSLVKSIPSNSGIFSINNLSGGIHVTSDSVIFFDVDVNDITFNAAALDSALSSPALKTVNSVLPVNNNLTIKDGEIIKISSDGNAVNINLIDESMLGILLRS
jgi:hypothetical protein